MTCPYLYSLVADMSSPPDVLCHSSRDKPRSMHVNFIINKPYQQTLFLWPSSAQRTRRGNDSPCISEEPIGSEYPAAPQRRYWARVEVPRANAVAASPGSGCVQRIIQSELQVLYRNFRVTISFWIPMYILYVLIKCLSWNTISYLHLHSFDIFFVSLKKYIYISIFHL